MFCWYSIAAAHFVYSILKLMCANLLLYMMHTIQYMYMDLCIEFHFSLGSLPLLIITYYPPHVHHCSILSNRHLFSAQIIHSFTLSLSLFLSVCEHLMVFFSFVCISWMLHFNVKLFFFFHFFYHRTLPIACSYLQVLYSARIIDEFSLIVSVRLVWLSFFRSLQFFLRWNGCFVATKYFK